MGSSQDDWMKSNKERDLAAFLPEGRVQVPLHAPSVKPADKVEMAFVDTLDMQSKLGCQARTMEQSMSLRDAELVRTRKVASTSSFDGGGTAKLTGVMPPSMLDLVGAEKMKEEQRKFWSSPERQSPLPRASQVQPVECAVPDRPSASMAEKVDIVLPPPPPAEDQPKLPPAPKPIIVEPISTPVVVTPVIDQSDRVAELETENAVLLQIITRLAAENKALKAKK